MGIKTIVYGLAQSIIDRDIPDTLPQRLIRLDMEKLIGQTYFRLNYW